MKKDSYKTAVLFLYNENEKELFAYFPKEYYNKEIPRLKHLRTCYAHVGQHSACSPEYAKESRQAIEKEYANLKKELENLGYNLTVLNSTNVAKDLKWNGEKTEIEYHRKPTQSEIKRGYGATHYRTFTTKEFLKRDATIKKRIKADDGLTYTR